MSVSFCLPHPVAVSAFMICRGLCACTEMFWTCVLYVSFGSKVRPRTFGCVAMGSASAVLLDNMYTNLQTIDSYKTGIIISEKKFVFCIFDDMMCNPTPHKTRCFTEKNIYTNILKNKKLTFLHVQ